MVARQAVVDVVNVKNLDLCVQNCVLVMEIAAHLFGWQRNLYLFLKVFWGQYLATNMLFSLFLVSCCIVLLRIMFKLHFHMKFISFIVKSIEMGTNY